MALADDVKSLTYVHSFKTQYHNAVEKQREMVLQYRALHASTYWRV